MIKQLVSMITTMGHKMTIMKSDNGLEFVGADVRRYLLEEAHIQLETTAPYSPHQNGIAERSNRTVCELTVASMLTAKVPFYLWEYAVRSVVYVMNRMPTEALNMRSTPYLEVHRRVPDISNLRIFGCDVYASIPEHDQQTLGPRSYKGIFVGYDSSPSSGSLAFLWYYPSTRKAYKSGHLQFNEELGHLSYTAAEHEKIDSVVHDMMGMEVSSDASQPPTADPLPA